MTTSRKTQPDPKTPAKKSARAPASLRQRWIYFGLRCFLYYCGVVLLLAFFQRWLMYPATRVEKMTTQAAGLPMGRVHDIEIQSADGLTLHGWHILPSGKTAVDQAHCDEYLRHGGKVFLFFPGNGGNRQHRADDYQILTGRGDHVMVFDYRGYGENPGSPTEAKLASDTLTAFAYVTETRKVPADRVIVYGESLGGGVATRLASDLCDAKTPPGGLVLRSTFSSMVDAAGYNYPWLPVRLVLVDRYLSTEKIQHVTCPILILHGAQDTIVPFELGKRLFDAAPEKSSSGIPKTFIELPRSNHNDVMFVEGKLFQDSIVKFLRQLK